MKTIMVMAGGTGGHVYPAMAVADCLKTRGWQVVWLCTEGGMENRLIATKPYEKYMITMHGVRGKGLLGWLMLPVKLSVAFSQAYQGFKRYNPNLVLGMGGFAAFPGGVMARLLGKPLVIHEQNSVAGLTNKTLSLFAAKVLTAFPKVLAKHALMVGNPVRVDISQLALPEERYKSHSGALKVLVVGGSLGAQALNEILPKAFAQLNKNSARPLLEIVHQAGEKHIERLNKHYSAAGIQAKTVAFIENMSVMYDWADVVICRAGALTIAELSAAGVASILVPFPFAVDDHQTTNAYYLSTNNAAILIPQTDLIEEKIIEILSNLTRENCLTMAKKARALGKPEATLAVANLCETVAL